MCNINTLSQVNEYQAVCTDCGALFGSWEFSTSWSLEDLDEKHAHVPEKCFFCHQPVFNDDRQVGTWKFSSNKAINYHIDCLKNEYPNQESYQTFLHENAEKIFKGEMP